MVFPAGLSNHLIYHCAKYSPAAILPVRRPNWVSRVICRIICLKADRELIDYFHWVASLPQSQLPLVQSAQRAIYGA